MLPFPSMVEAALSGDAGAQQALLALVAPAIRAGARRGRRGDASEEDIIQATWLRLLEHDGRALRRYDPGLSQPPTYFGGIAVRVATDFARRRRHPEVGGDRYERVADPNAGLERHLLAKDQAEKLAAHLESVLPERGRAIYRAYFVSARLPQEIARSLGVHQQVVYNWVCKIRRLARGFLR